MVCEIFAAAANWPGLTTTPLTASLAVLKLPRSVSRFVENCLSASLLTFSWPLWPAPPLTGFGRLGVGCVFDGGGAYCPLSSYWVGWRNDASGWSPRYFSCCS
jgi:hypothetical protein